MNMYLRTNLMAVVTAIMTAMLLVSCGGSGSNSGTPPTPPNMSSYDGNDYYARVTDEPDTFVLPGLPANRDNQVLWNSIALIFNPGSGTWTIAMNAPNYNPNTGHQIAMGPFTGVWTSTPLHTYQYRISAANWNTGLTGNVNPNNSGAPYAIFQPASPTDWQAMPTEGNVNLCSVSTNSVYTAERGGGDISCVIEVMDMDTSQVSTSRVHLTMMR